jgi:hypothetical protein
MSIALMASAGDVVARALVVAVTTPTSSTVPQDWHSPHRPAHFPVAQPHSVQRNWGALVELFAILSPER